MPRALPAALTTAMDSHVFKTYVAIGKRNYTGTPPASLSGYTTLITKILHYEYDGLQLTIKYASANLPETDGLIVGNKYFIERGVTIAGVNHTIKSASLRFDDYEINKQIITAKFSLFSSDEKPDAVAGDASYTTVLTALNPNKYFLGTVNFVTTPENGNHWGYKFFPAGKQVSLKSYSSLLSLIQQKYLIQATDNSDNTKENEVQFYHLRSPISSMQFSIVTGYGSTHNDVCYSPELDLFVAVGGKTGGSYTIYTSPNGSTWTLRTAPDYYYTGVAWSPQLSLFVAVQGSASSNFATSPDGITWTARSIPNNRNYKAVAWSPSLSLFVAIATNTVSDAVLTSPDGITWTARTNPIAAWNRVVWSPEQSLFVAVGQKTATYSIMTSPDGINWTGRHTEAVVYNDVCWSAELSLFIAVGQRTATYNLATSPTGITWTNRNMVSDIVWETVEWSAENSVLVAMASSGTDNRRARSYDGITWTTDTDSTANFAWKSLVWAAELSVFVGVANDDSLVLNGIIKSAQSMTPDHTITQGDIVLLKDGMQNAYLWRDEADTIHQTGLGTSPIHNLGYLESTAVPPANFENADRASVTVGIHLKYKTGDIFTLKINATQTATYLAKVTEILDPNAEIGWRNEIELIERFANTNAGAMPSTIERVAAYTPLVTNNFNGNLNQTVNNLQAFAEKVDDLDIVSTTEGDARYAPIAKGVTNGDSHDHIGGDGGTIAYTSLSGRPAAQVQTEDIYRVDTPGGNSAFVGTIATLPGGATLTYNVTSGNEGAMVPTATTQLGKMRLYNTTRGTSALISNCVTGTNTLTLTANVPGGWVVGDTITIASQTVSGGGVNWVDIEITSGPTNKLYMFVRLHISSATAGDTTWLHPWETYSITKTSQLDTQVANAGITYRYTDILKITSNVFSLMWTGTPSKIIVREAGYLE